ncbi:MAG: cupredoxin domain-containing protein [Chloroflexota bacterium]|nr:cupredoxin domain-containing protein [Chloroflexota bacterium]
MTDQPGREPEQRLPARRPPSEAAPVERFSAPPPIRKFELTPERAAQIVRQSSNARWIGFLATTIVVLFVVVYYFYELGAPLGLTQARLEAEKSAQQVTAVERGYNLFEANCARCHGPNGLGPLESPQPETGYIGPTLNSQAKLYQHLNEDYLRNVLTVGGRYVCGNAKSAMPVWADSNGGPLNYIQIQEIIAFIRAPSTQEYDVRDPNLNEPVVDPSTGKVKTFHGWVDPSYKPPAGATPFPDCWTDAFKSASGSPAPNGSPAATLPPDAPHFEITASNISYDKHALEVPAGKPFSILFKVQDPGQIHDVDIRKDDKTTVVVDQPTTKDGLQTTYVYPPLQAGTYVFICSIHPIPAMTGTLTVK